MKVKRESEVAQLCLTLSGSMDCSLPGSSIHGIFQARVLEWVAIAFSAYLIEPTLNISRNKNCHYPLKLEKAMAPHSSTPAWKIPWTEEPGGLQSMGSLRVGHD